ncbi:hypothetical protein GCM10028787_08910 [Brachybacterium horti]
MSRARAAALPIAAVVEGRGAGAAGAATRCGAGIEDLRDLTGWASPPVPDHRLLYGPRDALRKVSRPT